MMTNDRAITTKKPASVYVQFRQPGQKSVGRTVYADDLHSVVEKFDRTFAAPTESVAEQQGQQRTSTSR